MGRGNGGEWEWAGTHYFPLNISLFCKIVRLCLFFFFFLIGRDRSHGEENGEDVEKLN